MRLAVFGATGRIGRQVVEQALNAGHEVTALVRDPSRLSIRHERLRVVVGDARDFDRVVETVKGADAVVCTLGPRHNTPSDEEAHVAAVRNILEAMNQLGVRRLVTVPGAAVDLPGDRKGLADRLAGWLVRQFARHIYRAKVRELELLRAYPTLDWVAVRPPAVVPGPRTGRYKVSLHRPPGPRVSAGDVADFMLKQVATGEYIQKAPFIG